MLVFLSKVLSQSNQYDTLLTDPCLAKTKMCLSPNELHLSKDCKSNKNPKIFHLRSHPVYWRLQGVEMHTLQLVPEDLSCRCIYVLLYSTWNPAVLRVSYMCTVLIIDGSTYSAFFTNRDKHASHVRMALIDTYSCSYKKDVLTGIVAAIERREIMEYSVISMHPKRMIMTTTVS